MSVSQRSGSFDSHPRLANAAVGLQRPRSARYFGWSIAVRCAWPARANYRSANGSQSSGTPPPDMNSPPVSMQ